MKKDFFMDPTEFLEKARLKPFILFFLVAVLMIGGSAYLGEKTLPVTNDKTDELPIYCVGTDEQVISLTFDAAWNVDDFDVILEILDKYDIKATFFVTGEWVSKYPEAVRKLYDGGHDIGNHGDHHKHMSTLSIEENRKEMQGCHDKVKTLVGYEMKLFRAPYGDYDEELIKQAKEFGYQTIQWDVDSLDWKDYGKDSIVKTVTEHNHLGNGSIILLHNGTIYTKDALEPMIQKLLEQGYSFKPVSKLILTKDYRIDYEGRQYAIDK